MVGNDKIELVKREDVIFFAGLFESVDKELLALLRRAQIPNDLLRIEHDYQYLPEVTIKNLICILGEKTSLAEFSILITSACKQLYIPRFISKLSQQHSLKAALEEFAALLISHSTGAKVSVQFAGGKWWLVREKQGQGQDWFHYAELFSVVFLSQLLVALTAGKWQPREIGVQASSVDEFNQLPGLQHAQFYAQRPVTALLIPDELMQASINLPVPFERLLRIDEPQQTTMQVQSCFVDSLKLALKPYTSSGKLPISIAAQILNIQIRTLQRRLAKEGTVYSDLIEAMVLEHSLELLHCRSIQITTIATKMGYSDAAHFTRSFKRQMGMTPSQYRRSLCS